MPYNSRQQRQNNGINYNERSAGHYPQAFYPSNQQYQQAPNPPKKSGVIYSKIKKGTYEGATIINAWNKSKSKGLITAKIAPYHKSEEIVTSEKGHEYMKMICELTYQKTGQTKLIPCLYNMKSQRIILSDIGMMISPTGSGTTSSGKRVSGYFGTMFKK